MPTVEEVQELWEIYFSPEVSRDVARAVSAGAEGRSTAAELEAAGAYVASMSKGPLALDVLLPTLRSQLPDTVALRPEEVAPVSRELNRLLFAGMAEVCEANLAPGHFDEVLAFVRAPLWRRWHADEAAFDGALMSEVTRRWETERLGPYLTACLESLAAGAPLPTLPAFGAADPPAERLLAASGRQATPRAWLTSLLDRLAQDEATAPLREREAWPAVRAHLAEHDGYWRARAVEAFRGSRTDGELHQLAAFYESPAGERFKALPSQWTASFEPAMKSEAFVKAFLGWVEKLGESGAVSKAKGAARKPAGGGGKRRKR
jgi:hypothetical protein